MRSYVKPASRPRRQQHTSGGVRRVRAHARNRACPRAQGRRPARCGVRPRRGSIAALPITRGDSLVMQAARHEHQRWSTADVDPRRALAYWIETICHSFLEIDIDSSTRNGFRARLDQVEFGPATLNIVEADVQTVRRTRAHIAR